MTYDVAVVGAGAVGCSIAEALSAYRLRTVLIEAADDIGDGTSKANTAILHTGFDAKPGSMEARIVARGHALVIERAAEYGWAYDRIGAVLVAWDTEQAARLAGILDNAAANGYHGGRLLTADEVYALEPQLGPGATGGVHVPDEGLLDPWAITLAGAANAVVNGTDLRLDSRLDRVTTGPEHHVLHTTSGAVQARWVVNAAGLGSDTVDRMFGHDRFSVTPRRGQLIVFDKLARALLDHILLPVPTATTKGVLVSPTIYGNVLLGPTAEDLPDRTATETTADGLAGLRAAGRRVLPKLLDEEVTAIYAGLRPATEQSDYRYAVDEDQRYVCVGGIRSTGITGALALGEQVVRDLRAAGLVLAEKTTVDRVTVPDLAERSARLYTDGAAIARNPAYGDIVCHCERVTLGEIEDAYDGPVPPRSLGGLRRRTRALMGRCQGFYCGARVAGLAATLGQRS